MIEATTFAGKHVAVFGLGLSGMSAVRSLLAGGAAVAAWDDGEKARQVAVAAGVALQDLRGVDWHRFAALVLAPGVPLTHPEPHWTVKMAKAAGVEVIGDTEIFVRERRASGKTAPLIAITGTNGKSTTAALTHHLLKCAGRDAVLGGNIGTAVLDLPPFENGRMYVLELSSFQLELTPGLDADGAILLNITPDHLDRHGTMENYARVKSTIVDGVPDNGAAVIGADDAYCDAIASSPRLRRVGYLGRVSSHGPVATGAYLKGSKVIGVEGGQVINEASLEGIPSLRGQHNGQNAAAAMTLLYSGFGLDWLVLSRYLRTFPGLPHRMEQVRQIGDIVFINDSKATNADAASRALASFDRIYWIAGGKPKEGGIESLSGFFPKIAKAYLIGEAAEAFAATLAGSVDSVRSGTLQNAVRAAYADSTASGPGAVLLSPACASYDQFRNFEERGDRFRELVRALAASGDFTP
jgi:UDP-N-acetylmuramoylalanine--D-glutamate ligase